MEGVTRSVGGGTGAWSECDDECNTAVAGKKAPALLLRSPVVCVFQVSIRTR